MLALLQREVSRALGPGVEVLVIRPLAGNDHHRSFSPIRLTHVGAIVLVPQQREAGVSAEEKEANQLQIDSILQSIFIHAHLRGKDFTYVLTYPDGREDVLLRVPNYDFDWQFDYELAEPIRVPAGSTLKAVARYDNSRGNRENPAPHKETYWSEQSWDDMFLTTASYVLEDDEANDD